MKALNFEQIKKLVHGAARIEEGDGKISFFRFSREQQELYKTASADFYMKTFATAGITLEFQTDSENMELSVSVSRGSSRRFFTHSIFVNGERVDELSGNIGESENVVFNKSFNLGKGMKTVRILFPWSVASSLLSLKLDDNAGVVPVNKKLKLLMLGDSITQGYDAMIPENSYATQVMTYFNAEALNKGIAGEQFFPALVLQPEDFKPDLITVAYGTNDWRHGTKENFEQTCLGFFVNLRISYPNVPIIALTPLWRVDINTTYEFGQPLNYVSSYIKRVAKQVDNMTVIDCMEYIPHNSRLFQTDGVHPVDAGFKHYSKNIIKELENKIKK